MSFGLPRVPQPPSSSALPGTTRSGSLSRRGSGILSLDHDTMAKPLSRKASNVSVSSRRSIDDQSVLSSGRQRASMNSNNNGADVLQRFRDTQNQYESERNLKTADRLQQRLMWKEQMERSGALETQISTNKKTLLNLEKQMEHLKRELASERAQFDTDLQSKEQKLEDAKAVLRSRKQRLENADREMNDCRRAVARMRATLVENFVLDKVYSSKPDPDNPFEDVTREDYKFYPLHAAELEHRHHNIVERYIGGGGGGGNNNNNNASKLDRERVFGADPVVAAGGAAAKKNQHRKNDGRYNQQQQQQKWDETAAASSSGDVTALENAGGGVSSSSNSKKKGGPLKALSEVREMLVNLEKEMFEAENGVPLDDGGAAHNNNSNSPSPNSAVSPNAASVRSLGSTQRPDSHRPRSGRRKKVAL